MVQSVNPSNGKVIAEVQQGNQQDYEQAIVATERAWDVWADLPMPSRGEIVRQIGDALREKLMPLGKLVSAEMGKKTILCNGRSFELKNFCILP